MSWCQRQAISNRSTENTPMHSKKISYVCIPTNHTVDGGFVASLPSWYTTIEYITVILEM